MYLLFGQRLLLYLFLVFLNLFVIFINVLLDCLIFLFGKFCKVNLLIFMVGIEIGFLLLILIFILFKLFLYFLFWSKYVFEFILFVDDFCCLWEFFLVLQCVLVIVLQQVLLLIFFGFLEVFFVMLIVDIFFVGDVVLCIIVLYLLVGLEKVNKFLVF